MANILTKEPPRHYGERRLFEQVVAQESSSMYFWFGLEFIPGVSDIDLLIWSVSSGVFVVEVKAVPIEAIRSLSYSRIEIDGRSESKSPQLQAYDALISLRNFVEPKISRVPFMVATVAWPQISRADWIAKFSANKDIADLADRMLMADDLNNSLLAWEKKLRYIWRSPPIRKGGSSDFLHDREVLSNLQSVLDPTAVPIATKTDNQRLKAFENSVRKEILRSFPLGAARHAVFHGYPGTGKTFRLLQIALMHAREGGRVLLTCFNQVLASELQRIINLLDMRLYDEINETVLKRNILAIDISALAKRFSEELDSELGAKDYKEWGELIVGELEENPTLISHERFDTLLVDEAQDFSGWQIRLVKLLAKHDSSIVFGYGGNQELYQTKLTDEIDTALCLDTSYKHIYLRRNFRNLKPVYMLAAMFLDTGLEMNKIADTFRLLFESRGQKTPNVDFELSAPKFPSIKYLNDTPEETFTDPLFYQKQRELLKNGYVSLLRDELQQMSSEDDYRDLLLLVPSASCLEVSVVREALDEIKKNEGVGYIDLVESTNRRLIAPAEKIRLVTFHSCKGLEASRVMVFGIEGIDGLAKSAKTCPEKIGYIVLSRAIFSMTVCVRSSKKNNIVEFIERCLIYMNEHYNDAL